MHVAILDEELPFPLTSGKRIRTYQLLSRLAERHRLTYLCHRNPDRDESALAERAMRELDIRTVVVDRPVPSKSGLGFYARLLANLLSRDPYSVTSHRSAALVDAVQQLLRDDPPDLIHCEWTPYAATLREPFFRGAKDDNPAKSSFAPRKNAALQIPWVVMAHNVESLIWQRYAETESNPLKRWYIRRQLSKYERFERWAYSVCDCAIAVSGPDARLMRERFGARQVAVVDNGVDIDYFAPDHDIERDPKRLVFLGSLDWRPNLDAVRLLLEDIFPRIRQSEPNARLDLVGRRPPIWLKQLASSIPGVELHADVADVRPFVHRAGMMLVPLRIGGGSRLKILEALATGLAVISTRVGAEGLDLDPASDIHIADGPQEMAAAALDWMNDPRAAHRSAENGRQVVVDQYNWNRLAAKLESVWCQAARVTMPLQNALALSIV
jgi:glycosyltransferase involved in cell wall biosynthesis